MSIPEPNTRLFQPRNPSYGPPGSMKYYPASGLTFAKTGTKGTLSTIIIVGVDGACPSNQNNLNKASWGIYFGRNSQYNTCGLLSSSSKITNNVAEITAALHAVKLVSQRVLLGPREVKEVVIMSDSSWMVDSMTKWIENWRRNGWKTADNQPVKNLDLIRELDDFIEEVDTTLGLSVKFWHVKRKWNSGADRLANIALDHDLDWDIFWKGQIDGEKSAVMDFYTFRASSVEIMGPKLLCLEYPLTGKGEYISSLRTFILLQMIWKVGCLSGGSWTPQSKEMLQDELSGAILGSNWRRQANMEFEKNRGKIDTQTALLNNARKNFREGGDERKKKFAVMAEINNHIVMSVVSCSLNVEVPFAQQNEHYTTLIKQFLGDDPKWDPSRKFQGLMDPNGPKPAAKKAKAKAKAIARKIQKPEWREIDSGVRLDYGDDWVEVDYPST